MLSELNKQKILLIGPDGQVGHAVAKLLNSKDVPFVVAGLSLPNQAGESYQLDLSNLNQVQQLLDEIKPSIIINPAAYTAVDKAETERSLALAINAQAPELMAAYCKKSDATLIHYSTDYVFDGSGTGARHESDQTNPINYYGLSKREGELAIMKSGCRHIILRTSWVFSETGHNFVKTMLKLGQERNELRVVHDQIGAPTSAALLARASYVALEEILKNSSQFVGKSGIYHCACSGETTWYDFAKTIFTLAKAKNSPLKIERLIPITSSEYPTPAKRPLNSRLDCGLFQRTFSCELTSWQEELTSTLNLLLGT